MASSDLASPGAVLMDVLDLLEGDLAELLVMSMPAGDTNPMASAALSLSKSAWALKERSGKASWRDVEAVASNYHRALDPGSPLLREALLHHMATLAAMVMDLDRRSAAAG